MSMRGRLGHRSGDNGEGFREHVRVWYAGSLLFGEVRIDEGISFPFLYSISKGSGSPTRPGSGGNVHSQGFL